MIPYIIWSIIGSNRRTTTKTKCWSRVARNWEEDAFYSRAAYGEGSPAEECRIEAL